jgi:hypothetical protein
VERRLRCRAGNAAVQSEELTPPCSPKIRIRYENMAMPMVALDRVGSDIV